MCKRNKLLKIVLLFIIFLISIIAVSRLITTFDENYTLELVSCSYSKLVSIDTIDVHPPFYYLILKSFLLITSFWTHSIFIKIIFSRILSLIFSFITFLILYKILQLFNISKNECLFQLVLFIALPNVFGINAMSNEQLIDIRMYSLSALLVSLTLYLLIKYSFTFNYRCVILLFVSTVLTAYTNYYAFMIIILLLLFSIVYYIDNKKEIAAKNIIYIIILLVISYLPWIPILLKQMKATKSIFTYVKGDLFKQSIVFIVFVLIFGIPYAYIYKNINNKLQDLIKIIFMTLITSFILPWIYSITIHPMFRFRYLYPILLIYEVISVDFILKFFNKSKIFKIYSICILILLLFSISYNFYTQITHFGTQSIYFARDVNMWSHTSKKDIFLNSKNNKLDGSTQTNFNTQCAFYLTSVHKRVVCNGLQIPNAKDYIPLYDKVINNVKH